MSIPFVDREPEKQEIERLRQLLGHYYHEARITSLFFPNHSILRKIIAEAFGIPGNKLYDTPDIIQINDLTYKIVINPFLFREGGFSGVKEMRYPFRAYWEYLSEFNVNIENYRENPAIVGVASVDLLYKSDGNLDLSKSSFLYLHIGEGNRGQLSQYSYFVDPQRLRWYFDEEPNEYGIEVLCGCDIDVVFRIVINRRAILRYSNEIKEPDKNRKRERFYGSIPIAYFVSQHRRVWRSDIFQIEPLSPSQSIQYRTMTAAKEQKEVAFAQLEKYIRADSEEKVFQKLLTENQWMFGSEYSELLDRRKWTRDEQQDFMVRRSADGYVEMVEIKTSLSGKPLFNYDRPHKAYYPGSDLSKAIGQVINYLEKLDGDRHAIKSGIGEDVDKIRAKIIIGRDGDLDQQKALRRLNGHLHRIEILTYDQLLRVAKRSLADY